VRVSAKIIGSFSLLIVKPAFDVTCFVLLLLLLIEFFFSFLLAACFNITLDWRLAVEVTTNISLKTIGSTTDHAL
jgi:hypothetical protein